jgi:hypothetical protein
MAGSEITREDEMVHRMKNHLTVILGFCELLLEDTAPDDPKRGDLEEIRKAAASALADMPELARYRSEGL